MTCGKTREIPLGDEVLALQNLVSCSTRSGAQPALVIALADGHPPRAQDVVGGDGVEMEVGQRERENEGLRREGKPPRADVKIEVFARPSVDFVGLERLSERLRRAASFRRN